MTLASSLLGLHFVMLGSPFRARAAHVVELGSIGIGELPNHFPPCPSQHGKRILGHLVASTSPAFGGHKSPYMPHVSRRFPERVELRPLCFKREDAGNEGCGDWTGEEVFTAKLQNANSGSASRHGSHANG